MLLSEEAAVGRGQVWQAEEQHVQKPRGSWLEVGGSVGGRTLWWEGKVGDEVPSGAGATLGALAVVTAHSGVRGPVPASS